MVKGEGLFSFRFSNFRFCSISRYFGIKIWGFFWYLIKKIWGFFWYLVKKIWGFFWYLAKKIWGFFWYLAKKIWGFFWYLAKKILGFFFLKTKIIWRFWSNGYKMRKPPTSQSGAFLYTFKCIYRGYLCCNPF